MSFPVFLFILIFLYLPFFLLLRLKQKILFFVTTGYYTLYPILSDGEYTYRYIHSKRSIHLKRPVYTVQREKDKKM